MVRIKSPRLRYTLRGLFVFVTLFCVWVGLHVNYAFKERKAEIVLRKFGARYEQLPDHDYTLQSRAKYYHRLGRHLLLGEPFIYSVKITSALEEEVVEALELLPHLRDLELRAHSDAVVNSDTPFMGLISTRVPPAKAIERILKPHSLDRLTIDRFLLSPEAVEAISQQQSLQSLGLCGTLNLSDADLAKLIVLPRLRAFDLESCPLVTGSGLSEAPGSSTLEEVRCMDAPVGVEFATFLARCPDLNSFWGNRGTINDVFVAKLDGHPSLYELHLSGWTKVTDESIPVLERLPRLIYLSLPSETVSREGIERLRRRRPGLRVY